MTCHQIDVKREKFGENVTNMAVPIAPSPVKDAPQAPSERAPPPEAPSVTSRIQQVHLQYGMGEIKSLINTAQTIK